MFKQMKDALKENKGFSLVELIIVIYLIVVAVLFVLAFMKKITMIVPLVALGVPVALIIIGAIAAFISNILGK